MLKSHLYAKADIFLVFLYVHTLRMREVKALAELYVCADLSNLKPSLFADAISTEISRAGRKLMYYHTLRYKIMS